MNDPPIVPRPWAKLARKCRLGAKPCRASCDCPIAAILSLIGHSADVGAVLRALLDLPIVARRMASLLGQSDLSDLEKDRLVALGCLHDLGKINVGFQNRAEPGRQPPVGHIGPLYALLRHADAAAYDTVFERGRLKALAHLLFDENGEDHPWVTILAHHGDLTDARVDTNLWRATDTYDPGQACKGLVDAILGWCPLARQSAPMAWTMPFGHAFAGLLTLADWLGSDETWFPLPPLSGPNEDVPDGPGRFEWAVPRARALLRRRGLAADAARQAARGVLPDAVLATFEHVSAVQRAVLDLPPPPETGRTILLEGETGSGKTEAALMHFLDLFRRGEVDGLYFALPTRAAATQIHGRIKAGLERLLGQDAVPHVTLAVPGYLKDTAVAALPDPASLWPDDDQAAWQDAAWAGERPKRYLASFVAVGTVDQLLLGGLRVRHATLRSASMLRLLLVVDEVHASDVYMTTILRNVLHQHRQAGGHALLMSATLGSNARAMLLTTKGRQAPPPPQEAAAVAYPAVWTDARQDTPLPTSHAPRAQPKTVQFVLEPDWGPDGAVVRRAVTAARAGARVLVIRNTVRSVVATQRALEAMAPELLLQVGSRPDSVCAPHHARYAPEDRLLLDSALEAVLGKAALRLQGSIACCSQTAEQSLDIDADLLISDLCPADVLLQRIGRLHRHRRTRPAGFETPACVVLAPSAAELAESIGAKGQAQAALLGIGRVYPSTLGVLATLDALTADPTIHVPNDNRRLVEAATHPDSLRALAERHGGSWFAQWQHWGGNQSAEVQEAASACLDWSRKIGLPHDLRVTTRLGLRDRTIPLPPGTLGPFGHAVSRLTVPEHWLAGVSDTAEPVLSYPAPGVVAVKLEERAVLYDRLGLHPAEGARNMAARSLPRSLGDGPG